MPTSDQVQEAVRKAAAAVIGFSLALVLLTVLLLFGLYLLVNAAVLVLTPWLGAAGATALVGFVCLLVLALFFQRLTRPVSSRKRRGKDDERRSTGVDTLRNLIRKNPMEAAFMAFAVGVAEQKDPRLKSLLLEGAMALKEQAESSGSAPASAGEPSGDERKGGPDSAGRD